MTTRDRTSEPTRDLREHVQVAPDQLMILHARLADSAEADGLLDIAYRTIDTPVGSLLLASTEAGLVRVAYATEDHDAVLHTLADRISPRILLAPARLDPVVAQLEEYFAGRRRSFDVTLDWRLSGGFRATVLHHLVVDLDYGQTASYGAVARLAGNAKRPAPSVPPAPPIRCRWSCPAIVSSARTALWAVTSAASTPNGSCSPWRPQHDPRQQARTLDHQFGLGLCHTAGQTRPGRISAAR